jgi:peptidyl-prolyl cis-trans isomerase A (cyclophilin A)
MSLFSKNLIMITMVFVLSSAFAATKNPIVVMKTNQGDIHLELFKDKAPVSVKNFLKYTNKKFYNGTIFHRVINGFMVQGGGFDKSMNKKTTLDPIKNEATNGLQNSVGTVAYARTNVVDSATSQFFINVGDNSFLNHKNKSQSGFGYAVFGKVIKGMTVVNRIKSTATSRSGMFQNVPVSPIIIKDVSVLK